jgi:RNA polymerase sigma-70 factor (ECF subfamily)
MPSGGRDKMFTLALPAGLISEVRVFRRQVGRMNLDSSTNAADAERLDAVLDLFAQYQRRLFQYILSLVPSAADAEEVLQETNIVVWRKCGQFQPGSDFRAWVFRIALFEVRKFHERRRRTGVSFSEELLDQLSLVHQRHEELLARRQEQLADCVQKLRPADRELVAQVYGQEIEVPKLSQQIGREQTSIYRSLRRIRQLLFDCIESGVSAPGVT